jgi:hypothetical protein
VRFSCAAFSSVNITFPTFSSEPVPTEKQGKKANKLELNWNDLFSKQADLVNAKTTQLSEFPIDMSTLKNQLQEQLTNYTRLRS